MERSPPSPSRLLCFAAVPLAVLFPPSVHPSVLPLVLLLLAPSFVPAVRRAARPSPLVLGALLTALGVNFLLASYRHAAFLVMTAALAYGAAWTAGRRLDAAGRRMLCGVLALSGGLVALIALWQVVFGLDQAAAAARAADLDPLVVGRLESGRAFARFALPSQLGAFLLMALPAAVLVATETGRRQRWPAWVLWGVVALQGAALVATLSLGAFLAGGLTVLWLMVRGLPGRRARSSLAIAVVVLAAGGSAALLLRPDLAGLDAPHHPVRMRLGNWGVALTMFAEHPWSGVGAGGFGVRYPGYLEEGMNETRYAHSMPLQLLAEGGAWMLLPLVLGLTALWGRARRAQGSELLVGAGVLGFAAACLWDFHLYLPSLGIPFFLMAGAWFHLPERAPGSTPLGAVASAAAALVLVAAGLHLALVGFRRDATLRALDEHRWEAASKEAESWAALDPWDADPQGLLSLLHARAGRHAVASQAAWEAVRRDPWTPYRHAELSARLEEGGDRSGAWFEAWRAHRLYPHQEKYRRELERLPIRSAP